MSETFVFVSYARIDREPVRQVVDELRKLGIQTWVDADQLVAGESWHHSIVEALRRATAVLVFISPESMSSGYILREFEAAVEHGVRILPILLRPTPFDAVPSRLGSIQWLDMSRYPRQSAARLVAEEISAILVGWSYTGAIDTLKDDEREGLAKALTAQASGASPTNREAAAPDSVFVVHGHDDEFLHHIVEFVASLGVRPIVMKDIGGASVSLIQKFFEVGADAKFAIILLSADDMGASRIQYEHPRGGDRALKYRSRQNVVLELGYFYGLLGWDKVFVLERAAPESVPDFERPSDLNGVLFDRFDELGKWKSVIRRRLKDSGFAVDVVP